MNGFTPPHLRGAELEELLNWQHSIYRANRRAVVWHSGTKGAIRGGKTILMKSRPDFEGVLTCMSGRHVAFDAKVTDDYTYQHDRRRLHQLQDLWEVQEAGGVAFLLVSANLERFFLVWPQSGWATGNWRRIRLDRLSDQEGCEVLLAGGYKLPDWLDMIKGGRR